MDMSDEDSRPNPFAHLIEILDDAAGLSSEPYEGYRIERRTALKISGLLFRDVGSRADPLEIPHGSAEAWRKAHADVVHALEPFVFIDILFFRSVSGIPMPDLRNLAARFEDALLLFLDDGDIPIDSGMGALTGQFGADSRGISPYMNHGGLGLLRNRTDAKTLTELDGAWNAIRTRGLEAAPDWFGSIGGTGSVRFDRIVGSRHEILEARMRLDAFLETDDSKESAWVRRGMEPS